MNKVESDILLVHNAVDRMLTLHYVDRSSEVRIKYESDSHLAALPPGKLAFSYELTRCGTDQLCIRSGDVEVWIHVAVEFSVNKKKQIANVSS